MTRTAPSARLTADIWLDEGFRALSEFGLPALKAEVLATRLSTTKGSFYWHFKDVPDFKARMLAAWFRIGTADVMIANEKLSKSGPDKLQSLLALVSRLNSSNRLGGLKAEPAVREWARSDAAAAKVLKSVDQARIRYMAGLFRDAGLPRGEAQNAAQILYAGFVGEQAICVSRPHDMLPQLKRLLHLLLNASEFNSQN